MSFDWRQIPGFGDHDFEGFYLEMVAAAPPGSMLVEVGLYHGRSLAQLGLAAKVANKGLKVVGIDWGRMMGENDKPNCHFWSNILLAGLADDVTIVLADSPKAARMFADNSCWLVFIDAGHLHELVATDVRAWMPKVHPNGWLAGHDYRMHTVCEPVNALLGDVIHDPRYDNCWKARKQSIRLDTDIYKSTTIPQQSRKE